MPEGGIEVKYCPAPWEALRNAVAGTGMSLITPAMGWAAHRALSSLCTRWLSIHTCLGRELENNKVIKKQDLFPSSTVRWGDGSGKQHLQESAVVLKSCLLWNLMSVPLGGRGKENEQAVWNCLHLNRICTEVAPGHGGGNDWAGSR